MTNLEKLIFMIDGNYYIEMYEDDIIGTHYRMKTNYIEIIIYSEDEGREISIEVNHKDELIGFKQYIKPYEAYKYIEKHLKQL